MYREKGLCLAAAESEAALSCALVATKGVNPEGRNVDPQSFVGQALLSS